MPRPLRVNVELMCDISLIKNQVMIFKWRSKDWELSSCGVLYTTPHVTCSRVPVSVKEQKNKSRWPDYLGYHFVTSDRRKIQGNILFKCSTCTMKFVPAFEFRGWNWATLFGLLLVNYAFNSTQNWQMAA